MLYTMRFECFLTQDIVERRVDLAQESRFDTSNFKEVQSRT
jgi:hypothetical protein